MDDQTPPVHDIAGLLRQGNALDVNFNAIGQPGLRTTGGRIFEDPDPELRYGAHAARLYKEMIETDATVGGLAFVINNTIRNCQWKVARASDAPRDREAAEFVESCLYDLDTPWSTTIGEIMSCIFYGFSVHEILWKRRAGRHSAPWMNSRYADGRLGLRGLPIRGQDTIAEWIFDDAGQTVGCVQQAWNVPRAIIDGSKFLLFTQGGHKSNPEGVGLCRRLVSPYQAKRAIEVIERVGISRDLAGLPIALVDTSILGMTGDSPEAMAAQAAVNSIKEIVTRVRRDQLEGVVFPSQYDLNGKQLFEFKLLNSGGARNFNLNETVTRLQQEMYRSVQLDLMVLAQMGATGSSMALISEKRSMFSAAINGFLGNVAETLNRSLISQLMQVNGFNVSDYPVIEHESIEDFDVLKTAQTLQAMAAAGAPLFPNEDLVKWLLGAMGAPTPVSPDIDAEMAAKVPVATAMPTGKLREIPNDEMQQAGYTKPIETILPRTTGRAED